MSSARREFAARLDALYACGGSPPLRVLANAARQRAQSMGAGGGRSERPVFVSAQRISDWKMGRNVPARFEAVLPVLLVLIDRVRRRGAAHRPELTSLRSWNRLWEQAQTGRPGRRSGVAVAFAGRSDAVADLAEMVADADGDRLGSRIVVLTGASGVGKTTLLREGLVPLLEAQPRPWVVHVPHFGSGPLTHLEDVAEAVESYDRRPQLVIIDQFERIVAQDIDCEERKSFLRALERLAQVAVVLISCRSGDFPRCTEHDAFVEAAERRRYRLEPMGTSELRAAAEIALGSAADVEAGLVEVVLAALAGRGPHREPAELSILSRVLESMLRQCAGSNLTVASYRRFGGVAAAVHAAADEFWAGLGPDEQAFAKRVILTLVGAHAYTDDARRRIPYRDLRRLTEGPARGAHTLDELINARVVTVDSEHAYLSHDLTLTWPRLVAWLDRERPALIIRARIAANSSEWVAAQ
ncbi:hypothetical protein ACRCUN_28950 [Mycobacterium sp. LTG2003]